MRVLECGVAYFVIRISASNNSGGVGAASLREAYLLERVV